ncbi:fimbrial subunit [Salmonella enterica subsp. arizonae]|uniref:Fimbrial subunit n=1 Tax=Salmonella enterica subsp. arizonae TaxID=59203 RepID=A0A379S9G1_SALER|nr:fimbrial subunit [Salmonella enterica subsp. arizonae]
MKIHLLFTLLMGSAVSQYALADVCKNVNGVPSRVNYDLTTTLTAEQNQVGKTVQLEKNQGGQCTGGVSSRYGGL